MMVTAEQQTRVLLVEDDPVWRVVARTYLERNNCRVWEAEDGRDGIEQYRQLGTELHAVVSDMQMPYFSGQELARINAREHFLPFVICSTQYDHAAAAEVYRYGVENYLLKPVEERRLMDVLRAALLRRRLGTAWCAGVREEGSRIIIPARLQDVLMVQGWLAEKVRPLLDQHDLRIYIQYVHEFIMNAYEHGSLGIDESEKARLMEAGGYEEELSRREAGISATIELELTVINNMVILTVSDQGRGFNHERYMLLRPEMELKRLMMPNGRGILMGRHYFDAIRFERCGSSVALLKRVAATR